MKARSIRSVLVVGTLLIACQATLAQVSTFSIGNLKSNRSRDQLFVLKVFNGIPSSSTRCEISRKVILADLGEVDACVFEIGIDIKSDGTPKDYDAKDYDCSIDVIGPIYNKKPVWLVWVLNNRPASEYRFHAKRGINFPDDVAECQSAICLPTSAFLRRKTGVISHNGINSSFYAYEFKDSANDRAKAYAYNIVIEKKVFQEASTYSFEICGKVDPVVVNKD